MVMVSTKIMIMHILGVYKKLKLITNMIELIGAIIQKENLKSLAILANA